MKNNLKIGILTQPLYDNYGGLLQAYALKEVLKSLGHDVVIVNRQKPLRKKWRLVGSFVKFELKGRKPINKQPLTKAQKKIISEKTLAFIAQYIPEQSKLITSTKTMKLLNKEKFDAFVVGSDQCWRPQYSPDIKNYFLDFTKNNKRIKRISYAASFGTENWEFLKKETKECKKLLEKFDAISVREDSAISLIKHNLGRSDVTHVLDPTMLLEKSQYQELIKKAGLSKSNGNLNIYVLDKSIEKNIFIESVENRLGLKKFEVMPKKRIQDTLVTNATIADFQFPSTIEWLQGFQDAKFVITDSFHGTLFSILFNVPFIAIGNQKRGMSRFESLLKMFGFSDRLVTDVDKADLNYLLSQEIDWSFANKTLERERAKAMTFLTSNLD